jgi:hypothetical protein
MVLPVWTSRRGSQRDRNHDAGGLVVVRNCAMAIVVDEFTSSPSQGELARAVVSEMISLWHQDPRVAVPVVAAMMRQVHAGLRHRFRLSNAAYGILLTERGSTEATALTAGDCRVGVREGGLCTWLTQPHTKEETLIRLGLTPGPGDQSTVTRCFKPRRWMEPEAVFLAQSADTSWALATDGFGNGIATQVVEPDDDASCINFSWSGLGRPDTADGNWYSTLDGLEQEAG